VRLPRGGAALLLSVVLAIAYVVIDPHTADLAAQTARAELFRRSGFVPWWSGWYSGVATASYSLTTPVLLGWLGPLWLGAVSIVATGLIAVPLVRDTVRPNAAAIAIVIAAALNVFSGRTTFAVGAVVALATLLAVERRWLVASVLLAPLTMATSPVAGVLLLVVLAAIVIADPSRRRLAVLAGAAGLVVLVALEVLSRGDGGGYQPFTRTSLVMAVGTSLIVVFAPVGRRVRWAAVLTIVMLAAVYVVHSPIGSNATRIAVLATAPVIVASVRLSSRWFVVVLTAGAALLAVSQAHNDLSAVSSAYTSRSVVAPLTNRLLADPLIANHRVEVVDPATHWPSTYLLPDVALARGWERQTDEGRNPEFYGRAPLTAATYRSFLDRNAVAYVAEPRGVTIDYGSTREKSLIDNGLPYLHKVWTNPNWTLWAVRSPAGIATAPARVVYDLDTGGDVDVPAAGTYPLRLRWSPYLVATGGSIRRAADGSAVLVTRSPGVHRVHAVWRLP
jgi:hypothetical protein